MVEGLKRWLVIGPVILYSIILHEMAHGFVALLWGDPTALQQGRLTLNPLPHIDWIGSILLPLVLTLVKSPVFLAWAKPVEINPANFVGDTHLAVLSSALAGPATNLILALLFALALRLSCVWLRQAPVRRWIRLGLLYGIIWNSMLCVFNLMPIPPLDGFRIITYLFPAVERIALLNDFMVEMALLLVVLIFAQRFLQRPMKAFAEALLNWAEAPVRPRAL